MPAALFAACAVPAFADEGGPGAYPFRGDYAGFAPEQVVKDIGELELDDGEHDEWRRVASDNAPMPARLHIADEAANLVGAVAVMGRVRPAPPCWPALPEGLVLPVVAELAGIGGSGVADRVAVETIGRDMRFTTAACDTGAVPAL